MPEYFFSDTEKQSELKRILDEWLGTPFRHHCGVKRLGCDCIHFVCRVLEEMGILKWRRSLIPDYPRDWHLHNTRELLCEGIERELNVEKLSRYDSQPRLENLMNGDILCSHYGKAASHAGFYFDGYVYQSLDDIGVRKIAFSDRVFRRQIKFAYRILK